jgi:hypothetical protein
MTAEKYPPGTITVYGKPVSYTSTPATLVLDNEVDDLEFTVPVPDHWHGRMITKIVNGQMMTDPRFVCQLEDCTARNGKP